MSTAGSVRTAKSSRVPPLQRSPLMMFVGPRSRLGLRLTARPFLILRAPMPAVVFFFFFSIYRYYYYSIYLFFLYPEPDEIQLDSGTFLNLG